VISEMGHEFFGAVSVVDEDIGSFSEPEVFGVESSVGVKNFGVAEYNFGVWSADRVIDFDFTEAGDILADIEDEGSIFGLFDGNRFKGFNDPDGFIFLSYEVYVFIVDGNGVPEVVIEAWFIPAG